MQVEIKKRGRCWQRDFDLKSKKRLINISDSKQMDDLDRLRETVRKWQTRQANCRRSSLKYGRKNRELIKQRPIAAAAAKRRENLNRLPYVSLLAKFTPTQLEEFRVSFLEYKERVPRSEWPPRYKRINALLGIESEDEDGEDGEGA